MNKNRKTVGRKEQLTVKNPRGAKVICLALSTAMILTACGTQEESSSGAVSAVTSVITEENQEQVLKGLLNAQVNPSHSSEAGKEETVYVLADARGGVDQVIVSDWLKNSSGGSSLTDCSDLTDIENVKGYETFRKDENGNITWEAEGADIYYRGSTDKEVPVEVKLSYQLDGKDISPEELAGKSGRVRIRMDYINKETKTVEIGGKKQEIRVPFAMLSGMVLPQDTFSNIEVTNARLLSEGSNSVIVGIAFPGLKESIDIEDLKGKIEDKIGDQEDGEDLEDLEIPEYIEITADAENFELGMTMTIAMSDILSEINLTDSFDLSEINDSMDDLQEASDQLKDGTVELKDGSSRLKDGSEELLAGTRELWDGTAELKDGTQELFEKSGLLDDGAGRLSDGAARLDEGAEKLDEGASALLDGTSALVDGTETLQEGVSELTRGANSLQDGGQRLAEGTGSLVSGARELDAGADRLAKGILSAEAGAEQIQVNMQTLRAASDQLTQSSAGLYQLAAQFLNGNTQTTQELASVIEEELDQARENRAQAEGAAEQALAACQSAEETLVLACTPEQYSVEVAAEAGTQTVSQEVAVDVEVPVTTRTFSSYQTLAGGEDEDSEPEIITEESVDETTSFETQTVYETVEMEVPVYETETIEVQSLDTSGIQEALAAYREAGNWLTSCEADVAAYDEQIAALESLSAVLAQGAAADAQAEALLRGLEQLAGGMEALDAGLGQLSAGVDTLAGDQGLKALRTGADQLKSGTASAVSGAQELDGGANALKQGITALNEGAGRLSAGTGSLKDGAAQLKSGTQELKSGTSELKNGTSELRSGAGELKDGTTQLVEGTGTLNDGAGTLKDGVTTLQDGVLTLDEGVGTLDEGMLTLMDGMFEFDEEGISKLTGLFGDDVQDVIDRLKAVSDAGKEYKTFTSLPEGMDGSVKFIIKTEGIKG